MVNEDLARAPVFALDPIFSVSWYEPSDEASWLAVQGMAERILPITPALFTSEFASEEYALAQRQLYLYDVDGRAVATGTAWGEKQGTFAGYGRVHWIAVIPELQGKGLGKMVVSLVCCRLLELGHVRAFLLTSTLRPVAIGLYEKFGFRIVHVDD